MTHSSLKDIYSPESFGLSSRTRISTLGTNHIAFVVDRKSRIIMKDGRIVLEKAEKVWDQNPNMTVSLRTNAPVCSKTRAFLNDRGIDILPI